MSDTPSTPSVPPSRPSEPSPPSTQSAPSEPSPPSTQSAPSETSAPPRQSEAADSPGPSPQAAGAAPAATISYREQHSRATQPQRYQPWPPPPGAPRQPPGPPKWLTDVRPEPPAGIRPATFGAALATALLSALLLGEGLGPNLLVVAVPAALAAYFAARAAGRRLRPWTLVWAAGGLALLAIPALRDAGWPTFLAVSSALALGSLALHGNRTWAGILVGSLGIFGSLGSGPAWAWRGLRERAEVSRGRWAPMVRTTLVAVVLLIVFGALFASADAAFADLLGGLTPDVSVADGPWRTFLFALGLLGALAAARTAAAPMRWDRLEIRPGRARGRSEWALPLVVLNLLFAAFIAVQLAVLFGGYDKVLSATGLTYAQYARQGFWQLLWATLLVLLVIALALRWAPRGGARDRTLVRSVLGTLCVLTLVVVASALRRMDLYVDAYGLTRLRVSVAAVELWLGVVIVLIMAAGVLGSRLLPRAVAASAAVAVLAFGLVSPDGLVAEQNVARFHDTRKLDVHYFQDLSADAVPALDTLPEPQRSCALVGIAGRLDGGDEPWYATSLGAVRAREILAERPLDADEAQCRELGTYGTGRGLYDEY
ncbi:DUF4153 domain-containing protein [Streptomyces chryseus]|uniref:DUF4153 domain-containing protein n=1 Tax=Streptomyces chryseus TaxID=68186 RepID=UPI00110F91BD|nr:DUF4173 domain-containing protein [Streptomyces chryseus]GGX31052.1 hypothetical protein GCM10010353_52780 [Streptomyces chryseus]